MALFCAPAWMMKTGGAKGQLASFMDEIKFMDGRVEINPGDGTKIEGVWHCISLKLVFRCYVTGEGFGDESDHVGVYIAVKTFDSEDSNPKIRFTGRTIDTTKDEEHTINLTKNDFGNATTLSEFQNPKRVYLCFRTETKYLNMGTGNNPFREIRFRKD